MKILVLVAKSSSKLDFSLAYTYLCGMKLRTVIYSLALATLCMGCGGHGHMQADYKCYVYLYSVIILTNLLC